MRQSSLQSVLRLFVSPQVHLPLEAFPTLVAAEGLEAGVFAAVSDEVGALAERFAAHLALMRLLPYRTIKTALSPSAITTITTRMTLITSYCTTRVQRVQITGLVPQQPHSSNNIR